MSAYGEAARRREARAEMASHDARAAAEAEVSRQCGQDLHHAEMDASHGGLPVIAEQSATHGAWTAASRNVPAGAVNVTGPLPVPQASVTRAG